MFITFEGPDGSGKTTILKFLFTYLQKLKVNFILTREPGSKHISKTNEAIRKIIVDSGNDMTAMTEAILFAADRRLHLEKVIWPALKRGQMVLCDRYFDSTFAYQGIARNLGLDKMIALNENITDKTYPDMTIYFDLPIKMSIQRVSGRLAKNRLDKEGNLFVQKVHEGYHMLIKRNPERFRVVDASQKQELVFKQVQKIFDEEILIDKK